MSFLFLMSEVNELSKLFCCYMDGLTKLNKPFDTACLVKGHYKNSSRTRLFSWSHPYVINPLDLNDLWS